LAEELSSVNLDTKIKSSDLSVLVRNARPKTLRLDHHDASAVFFGEPIRFRILYQWISYEFNPAGLSVEENSVALSDLFTGLIPERHRALLAVKFNNQLFIHWQLDIFPLR
jgi:hypothetical protein